MDGLGETYRALRLRKKWSQSLLARELEVSQSMISQIERGMRRVPREIPDEAVDPAAEPNKLDRSVLDGALALGEAGVGQLVSALACLGPQGELDIHEPTAV